MSELNEALKRFEFMSMNDVTPSSLKTAFKSKVLQSHPDKEVTQMILIICYNHLCIYLKH